MQATIRRKLAMGRRALDFGRAHPDASAGYTTALARLEERLARADQLASKQRNGILQVRAATARKLELRQTMTQGHIRHLASVAREAEDAGEAPGLERMFVLRHDTRSYQAFRAAARDMAVEAQANRELLVRYGLSETVLDDFEHTLDKFDTAVGEGDVGRRLHVGATADLMALADAVLVAVEVMSGLNRIRFANDPDSLAAWESASSVATRTPAPAAGDEAKPAA